MIIPLLIVSCIASARVWVCDRWKKDTHFISQMAAATALTRPDPKLLSSLLNPVALVLRDQLLAAQQQLSSQGQEGRPQGPAQNQNSNIDPAISGNAMLAAANSQGPQLGQVMPQIVPGVQEAAGVDRKHYGKRELSTSKRAAQNRAAQV